MLTKGHGVFIFAAGDFFYWPSRIPTAVLSSISKIYIPKS
jgi:hypothetical protein